VEPAFAAFIHWLDAGVESDGRSYTDMHARLVSYFARKGCTTPHDLADETLTRVARRLREEGTITGATPAQYCYIVARFVLLEYFRAADARHAGLAREVQDRSNPPDRARERLLTCLDDCLGRLGADDRELILAYYSGDGPGRMAIRRGLAAKYGLSANALTIRASRLRERLRTCVAGCQKDR
jgi:DNA-directed RNA polymerase specialized sigma24 family protein